MDPRRCSGDFTLVFIVPIGAGSASRPCVRGGGQVKIKDFCQLPAGDPVAAVTAFAVIHHRDCASFTLSARGPLGALRIGATNRNLHFFIFSQKMKVAIYILGKMVYDNLEQSRRPRVKCHWDGELPGGRRKFLRWGHRTRCAIWDLPPYM